MTVTVRTAYVSQPNTPETDRLLTVPHTVEGTAFGRTVTIQVNATDPADAMRVARLRPWEEWTDVLTGKAPREGFVDFKDAPSGWMKG
jgi:hypothetical protein